MKIKRLLSKIIIVTGISIALGITSCTPASNSIPSATDKPVSIVDNKTNDSSYQDFMEFRKYPEETLFFLRCAWYGIENYLSNADFCIIADREILKQEPFATKPKVDTNSVKNSHFGITHKYGYDPWEKRKVDERIKIYSVIFGDVPGEELLISRVIDPPDFNKPYYDSLGVFGFPIKRIPIAIPFSPPPDSKNQKMILFGNRKGDDYSIVFSLWADQEIVSLQAIKTIKELQAKEFKGVRDVFLEEKQDLLTNSNNSELLSYLFRRCQRWGNLSEMIELIKCLSDKNPSMVNRRFFSYGFSIYVLYELSHRVDRPKNPEPVQGGPVFDKWVINDSQENILVDIATKKFSEVTSISEGVKYLRLIGMFTSNPADYELSDNTGWSDEKWQEFNSPAPIDSTLFKKIPVLKNNLKAVAQTLSERFANDKDYPEWQKWANKIFPDDKAK